MGCNELLQGIKARPSDRVQTAQANGIKRDWARSRVAGICLWSITVYHLYHKSLTVTSFLMIFL